MVFQEKERRGGGDERRREEKEMRREGGSEMRREGINQWKIMQCYNASPRETERCLHCITVKILLKSIIVDLQ